MLIGSVSWGLSVGFIELELELIQTQMTQKPMLRVEVGARALRNQTGGGGLYRGFLGYPSFYKTFFRICSVNGVDTCTGTEKSF